MNITQNYFENKAEKDWPFLKSQYIDLQIEQVASLLIKTWDEGILLNNRDYYPYELIATTIVFSALIVR